MALNLIIRLFKAVTQQQKVVEDQEDSVQFRQEANVFVDVDRLTGITMQEETEQLCGARGILADLNARLSKAIAAWGDAAWNQLTSSETDDEEEPWSEDPIASSPQPVVEEQPAPLSRTKNVPHPSDPTVSARARHVQQWTDWTQAPTIHNPSRLDLSQPASTPWWMQDRTHYGLCQPTEQGQLESAARAAQFNRAHPPAPAPARYRSFPQEVRQTQKRRFLSSAVPAPPAPGVHLSYSRPARSCSDDFWLDEQYDPDFWQKNLRPGDIWTDAPARYPIPPEDNLSPRSVYVPLNLWDATTPVSGLYPRQTIQVGGTDPSSYFPVDRRRDLRNLLG